MFVVKTDRRRLRHVTSERIGHFSMYAPINVKPGCLKVHYVRAMGLAELERGVFLVFGSYDFSSTGFRLFLTNG